MKTMTMMIKLAMMWLYDDDDDDYRNDENYNDDDNENDMNDDDDDDDDPYKKVLVKVNKTGFTTSSKIKMCSIIGISYICWKL